MKIASFTRTYSETPVKHTAFVKATLQGSVLLNAQKALELRAKKKRAERLADLIKAAADTES